MRSTQMINENQLDTWVRGNSSQAQLVIVELVLRLVSAACPRPSERRFPLEINQQGPDGFLVTNIGYSPFVPDGKSYWEIGTGSNPRAKAADDYKELTEESEIPKLEREQSTFVFVTPLSGRSSWKYTWKEKGIANWLKKKRDKKDWKEVMVIDGTLLVDWLSRYPAISHWLGSIMGRLPEDFDTAEYHWQILREHGAPPSLEAELFTSGRINATERLKQFFLAQQERELRFDTRYPTQSKDFVCAFIASLPEDLRHELQGTVLILSSPDALKQACSLNEAHVFVADFTLDFSGGSQLIQRVKNRRHSIIFSSTPGGPPHGNSCELSSPTKLQIKAALKKSGYSEERARILSNRAGRNLNALLRLIQGLSASPDWSQKSEASDLAIAQLIGKWREDSDGDHEVISELSGKQYGEWIKEVRRVSSTDSIPLVFYDGCWRFTARFEPWLYLGRLLSDETLDKFEDIAVKVLSEENPKLTLPKENRAYSSMFCENSLYSQLIRDGIAESLALLGSHGDSLSSCTSGKPKQVASAVVRKLLKRADANQWASLNDVMPLLAEASPITFLEAVGNASDSDQEPFSEVFAQEGDGFWSGSFTTGLLWALESLAWSPDYLSRVCCVLANLASIDPGGQLLNRPINSLITILLPWLPQSASTDEERHSAVQTVIAEQPEIAWKLILGILPHPQSTSMGTHRPLWRDYIPEDWKNGVSQEAKCKDEAYYADSALRLAGFDTPRLVELMPFYFRINKRYSDFKRLYLSRLGSVEILNLSEESRYELWKSINSKVLSHRKYSDSVHWKASGSDLVDLERISDKIKPTKPEILYARLFSNNYSDLLPERGNFERQVKELQQKRIRALGEIMRSGGFESLKRFWRSVPAPYEVGKVCASESRLIEDSMILPSLLESSEDSDSSFVSAYVLKKFTTENWDWIDRIDRTGWSTKAVASFLSILPFMKRTWKLVAEELGEEAQVYWTTVRAFADPDNLEGLAYALRQLTISGRPEAAIQCLSHVNYWTPEIREVALDTLETFREDNEIDPYHIGDIISKLQTDKETDENRLVSLELKFLSILNNSFSTQPVTLYFKLAKDPDFFCSFITSLYRSEEGHESPSEENKNTIPVNQQTAPIVFRMLQEWNYPPGLMSDGSFDDNHLERWNGEVCRICSVTGNCKIAFQHIGQVLFYSPQDELGLWSRQACILMNSKETAEYRRGLRVQIYNSRGVFGFSEGKEELELSAKWGNIAKQAEKRGYSRLATALRKLETAYKEEARSSVESHLNELD